jgi:ATP-dependent Clp protease ATP-binding subunit ClpC
MDFPVSIEARAVLDEAAILSVRRGKYYVGVEHIFEAILTKPGLLPDSFASKYVASLARALDQVRRGEWQGVTPVPQDGEVYYTPRALEVMRRSAHLAQSYRRGNMKRAHLLLVILDEDTSEVCRAIDKEGLDRDTLAAELRKALLEIRDAEPASGEDKPVSSNGEEKDAPISLDSFTSDLTAAARAGELTKPYGRDKETLEIVQVLLRKEKNNVILLGEPGVGKTKIIEGLAVGAANGELRPLLGDTRVIELNFAAHLSGTQYRGSLEGKIKSMLDELAQRDDTILFIDEIHLMMGAGATDSGAIDLANLLKPVLGRGKLRCIGATTPAEYRKFISKDPAIERRFHTVEVGQLSPDDTYQMLKRMKADFGRHHGVSIGRGVMTSAVKLSERYLPKRQFPDKAIDVVDQACARFHLKMVLAETNPKALKATVDPRVAGKVTPHDVRKVISAMCSISLSDLNTKEREQLTSLEQTLNNAVIGQERAVAKIVPPIRKSKVGMSDPRRPDAVLFFMGPTGVGKTQLAKDLADETFGSSELLYTFDMSEFAEEHSVSRLLGVPPGYVGHEEDSNLYVYMLNTPYCMLLFDEIEKAHPKIFDVFLPMLDEGRLKDTKGREISFRNAVILFTSNIGADTLNRADDDATTEGKMRDALTGHFRPEFLNRIDAFVPFHTLEPEHVRSIVRLMIDDIRRRLADRKIGLRMYESAYRYLGKAGYDRQFGARELRRAVERYIADPISELLLQRRFAAGDKIDVRETNGRLVFERGAAQTSDSNRIE